MKLQLLTVVCFLMVMVGCIHNTPPPPPTLHQSNLTWRMSDDKAYNYTVYKSAGPNAPFIVLATGVQAKAYVDKNVSTGQLACYEVTAKNTAGQVSPFSNIVCFVIPK